MAAIKKKSEFAKLPVEDKTILTIGYIILGLFIVAIIMPMVYIILASFIDPVTLQNTGLTFDFSKWTITAYERVLSNAQIWVGFRNAIIYSVLFTVISVAVTLLAAYPMSRSDFKGGKFFNILFMITMFFGGGLIPTYLLISSLGMLDTIWAILLPGAFSVWNMIIARTYYQGIPKDLQEAAEIDGATWWDRIRAVTLPMISPTIFFNLILGIIGSFQAFGSAFLMTDGGPEYATYFLVLYIYQEAFDKIQMGRGSAIAWILFIILLFFTLLQFWLSRRWVYYEGEAAR